jgi:anti-sigma B factor antagonist
VCDPGPGFEVPSEKKRPGPDETSGWGLYLVEELAGRWGVERRDKNKCVWFELRTGPLLLEGREERNTGAGVDVLDRAFSAEVREKRGVPVVGISGDVDLKILPELQSAIEKALARAESLRIRSVVLDFRKIDFFDSTGIGLLVGSTEKLRKDGGEVHLAAREGPCLLVLRTTGLDKVFKIHPDLQTALEAARSKSWGALTQPPFTGLPTSVFSGTVFEEASNHTSIVRA